MTDLAGLLRRLQEEGVDFIVVGGVAAVAHGSARLTQDLDVIHSRKPATQGVARQTMIGESFSNRRRRG
jgi:hypothetical protein